MRELHQPSDQMGNVWPGSPTPVITAPADGATGILIAVALGLAVAPAVIDGDPLVATDWEIRTAPNGGGTLKWGSANDPLNLLGILVPALTLAIGQDYYIRVRFRTAALGPGPWSADVHIHT